MSKLYNKSESQKFGTAFLDGAVKVMRAVTGGSKTTKKAAAGYAKRNKNRINKEVTKGGG